MGFQSSIDGDLIACRLSTDRDLPECELCFSGLIPVRCETGLERRHVEGGFMRFAVPPMKAGTKLEMTFRYENPDFRPMNRAWLPLAPYLKVGDEIIELPLGDIGVHDQTVPEHTAPDGLALIPPPTRWSPASGRVPVPAVMCDDEAFEAVDRLAQRRDLDPFLGDGGHPVRISEDPTLAPEAYRLSISAEGVHVSARDRAGRFYAAITLLNLMILHDRNLPCGDVEDRPAYGWRGQQLDCARHYYGVDFLERLLDLMALLKLNRFHWHFADDEAFRLELKAVPDLWQKTAFRGEGELLPGLFGGGARAGGTYSKQDTEHLTQRARDLSIEILPEVEFPAHALALAKVYPETRDPDDTGTEESVQAYRANVLNPAMEATWTIFGSIVDEVAELFPAPWIHLGCDELPEDTWMGSPKARDLMAREKLDDTVELQGWAIEHLADRVRKLGKRPAVWEEATHGSRAIGTDALVFAWTGTEAGRIASKAGYEVVMTPAHHVYLDMAQSDSANDWGATWAATFDLEGTMNWTPRADEASADRIAGVQGAFWSEFTLSDEMAEPMIFPRILGVAAKAWSDTTASLLPDTLGAAPRYVRFAERLVWRTGPLSAKKKWA